MASSKKTGASKSKSAKNTDTDPKIEDAVIVEDQATAETNNDVEDAQGVDIGKKTEASKTAEPSVAETPVSEQTPTGADEPAEDTKSEPAKTALVTTSPPEQKSVFLPLVLGGIIAGALGFMASEYQVFGRDDAAITTQLRSDLNTQQERLAALEQAEPPAVEVPEVDLAPIEEQLAALESRITSLEDRPAVIVPEGMDAEAAAAYAAELETLKAEAATQRSEIEALISNAKSVEQATAEAARSANGQAAIAKIVSAIDAGQPFPDAAGTLQNLELGDIDPALTGAAGEGVATLSALQADFPELARAALSVARSSNTGDGQQGIGGFFTRSLGVRSVAPREGDDPDAVLSRAEAALQAGDLKATLNELDALPEEAQAVMADWRAAAQARVSARTAADALAQRLTAD